MKRVVIIGNSGAGKTTLAQTLSRRLKLIHIELDALHWEAGWQAAEREVFRERVRQALEPDSWVVDGNYSAVRDLVWTDADTLIWLDYTLLTLLVQLTRRTVRQVFRREPLWNGNIERFRAQFLSRDSLYWWVITTYARRRREFPLLLARPDYAHLKIVHLERPLETRQWLASLP